MTISTKKGVKGPNDKIVFYNGMPITMKEFGEIYALLCQNEEMLYPKPRFKGSDMFVNYLEDVRKAGGVTEEIIKKYKL